MNRGGPGIVSISKGAHVTCRQLEIIQRPVARDPHIACYLDKPGRNSREERYLEMIEGYRQTISNRFDVCFFAGPAAQKGQTPVARSQGEQFGNLSTGKKARRNGLWIVQLPKLLHIDSKLAIISECMECHLT
jgi:hypothetical protein